MKVGIIGSGAVGAACAMALMQRGSAREIVLVDRTRPRATAGALDMRYGGPVSPTADIRDGSYEDLKGAEVVMITAGINEKTGGATNRGDAEGRLKLLDANVSVYKEIVPQVVAAAPDAVGRGGVVRVLEPPMSADERAQLHRGNDRLRTAGARLRIATAST